MSLYIYVGETGFIFMVTGYSLDHVEHVIKQIFVMFKYKHTAGLVLCAHYKSDTTLTTELPLLSQSFCL